MDPRELGPKDLQEAIDAREIASAYYLSNPRVTLIDVGWKITNGAYTGELAVRVHLRDKPPEPAIETMRMITPRQYIDKSKIPYPVDIIEAEYPLQGYWWFPQPDGGRNTRFDPLQGGISVSGEWLFGYGTLGCIVEDRDTREKMLLSNWHVLAGSDAAVKGTRIFQPAFGDGGSGPDTIAFLERHAFDQGIDAAVATLNGARGWKNDQLDIGPITGCKEPALSMQVIKSGRGSQVTHGIIDGIEGVYPIDYNGFTHTIKHVFRMIPLAVNSQVSAPGDSGTIWQEEATGEAVGLHFAGENDPEEYGLAIHLPQVLDALNVDIAYTSMVPETLEASRNRG